MSMPELTIVTTHCKESPLKMDWVLTVLGAHNRTSIVIYDCGIVKLPMAMTTHPRVTMRKKHGTLVHATQYYSFFDHIAISHASLTEYTLFLHAHVSSYHRLTPVRAILRQVHDLLSRGRVDYLSIGDAVISTWTGCAMLRSAHGGMRGQQLSWCTDSVQCPSMAQKVRKIWASLESALGQPSLLGEKPTAILDANGAEALVHRCRLRARSARVWARLRDLMRGGGHHSRTDYAIEGAFHWLMGEPWVRPALVSALSKLNWETCAPTPLPNASLPHGKNRYLKFAGGLSARAGVLTEAGPGGQRGTKQWKRQWRDGTVLALALRGVVDVHSDSRRGAGDGTCPSWRQWLGIS